MMYDTQGFPHTWPNGGGSLTSWSPPAKISPISGYYEILVLKDQEDQNLTALTTGAREKIKFGLP